jgi:hypothetical protein
VVQQWQLAALRQEQVQRMKDKFVATPGKLVVPEDLQIQKAKDTAHVLRSEILNWVSFIECRQVDEEDSSVDPQLRNTEIIVFDTDVEVPQRPKHDIRRTERIAVAFNSEDKNFPEVLAMREDFPLVPHTNLRCFEIPRSLCIYDQPYDEIKLHWTAPVFIERIRSWLARTASGTLHEADQQLEPLLIGSPIPIILPPELLFSRDNDIPEKLTITLINNSPHQFSLVAERASELNQSLNEPNSPKFVATIIFGKPQLHGVIRKQPQNLFELHQFLEAAGVDLLSVLRGRLSAWQPDKSLMESSLVIVLVLPKTRDKDKPVENSDIWAFLCVETKLKETKNATETTDKETRFLSVREIGEHIGLWKHNSGNTAILIPSDTSQQGEQISVALLNPSFHLSREDAAHFNGFNNRDGRKITSVGLGALGSQVFLNLIRAAYGEWHLVDKDFLLPHNLAHHGLYGNTVGWSKAESLAIYANSMINGAPIASFIVADVLDPGELAGQVNQWFSESDVIFDFSASIAVARYLCHDVTSLARRASLFLNPAGTDLVLLIEDLRRQIPLTSLEMQYYRFLIHEPSIQEHLRRDGASIRYARSCRDVSSTISQEHVALHAAIGSGALRRALSMENAVISIWQSSEDGSVRNLKMSPYQAVLHQEKDWVIYTDEYVLKKVHKLREERLPNETGGSLIGSFDMHRRVIYIVDTLPSPPDSKELPTGYIRGHEGLREREEEIKKVTGGNLHYVGEWHSHPQGHGCNPSDNYDVKLFNWITEKMMLDGFLPLMLIVGDGNQHAWYVGDLQYN